MGLKEDPDFDFNGFERSDWEFEKVDFKLIVNYAQGYKVLCVLFVNFANFVVKLLG
jgi:hypothetical protein